MKTRLLEMLVMLISLMADATLMREFADMVLDWAEDRAVLSENTLDDKIVLPLCQKIRDTFNIEDNDAEEVE